MAIPATPAIVKDLGELVGPVLVFGGAYSNLQALQALLELAARELKIPARNIIHTGDVVAYCAQPVETSELLKISGVHCVMGNCEESVGVGNDDCGCGFPEDSACNAYSLNWYAHVMSEFKGRDDLQRWMRELPRRLDFTISGRRFSVVHGSPRHISEFLWPSSPGAELAACFGLLPDADGIICGHSGLPFARLVDSHSKRKLWLNAGVIGMPANDGTQRTWFSVLSPCTNGGLEVAIRPLNFDAQGAADAIIARKNLVRGYADSLLSGIWPSHDILPVEEQMRSGVALDEFSLVWLPDSPGALENMSLSRLYFGLALGIVVIALVRAQMSKS